MLDINAGELIFLIILGIILFGPEKLPDVARKLARVIVYLRGIANSAQESVRKELGPEYADLELADLHPKRFIAKQIANYSDVSAEIASVGQTVSSVKNDISSSSDIRASVRESIEGASRSVAPAKGNAPRFDPEAT